MKTLEERFLAKTSKTEKCWHWTGYKMKSGFGQINLGRRGEGVDYVHRVSFRLFVGELPEELVVIQKCGLKSCVNPEHLYLAESRVEHTCTDVKQRLMERIEVSKHGCWNYTGCRNSLGYGRIGYGARELGVNYAHRISWEIHYGEIPLNLFVLHKCDNSSCVNPEHLFLGTQTENVYDCIDKGRMWYQK